ncbi:UNVERIFIED_CONTAM: hypothetical protein FKN15_073529 [Acipenser sinensis]
MGETSTVDSDEPAVSSGVPSPPLLHLSSSPSQSIPCVQAPAPQARSRSGSPSRSNKRSRQAKDISDLKSQMAQVLEYLVRQQAINTAPALAPAPRPIPPPLAFDPVPSEHDEGISEENQDMISIDASWDGESISRRDQCRRSWSEPPNSSTFPGRQRLNNGGLYSDWHKLRNPSLFRCSWIFWRRFSPPGNDRPQRRASSRARPLRSPWKVQFSPVQSSPVGGLAKDSVCPNGQSGITEAHLKKAAEAQISDFQGQALGRSLAGLVVARRQLRLSQARVPDADKSALLDAPISPGHTFGPVGDGVIIMLLQRTGSVSAGGCNAIFPVPRHEERESTGARQLLW